MQGTIYYLQQELKKSKEKIVALEAKNQELCDLIDNSRTQSTETNGTTAKSQGNADNVTKPSTFNDDESSNDSSYLILEVNPEGEEYATMLTADEDAGKAHENEELDYKNKRMLEESSKNVPPKKQKRITQEFADTKDSKRE